MQQLLPFEFTRGNEFMEVIITKLNNKKIDEIFKDFKENEDLFFKENLSHLKRINKDYNHGKNLQKNESYVLLCAKEDFDKIPQTIKAKYSLEDSNFIEKVPKNPPFTKKQFDEWKVFWPIKHKISSLEKQEFSLIDSQKIKNIMKNIIDLSLEAYTKGNRFNSCLLYDFKADKVLITTSDNTSRSSFNIRHCVMRLMEEYSKKIGTLKHNDICYKEEEKKEDDLIVSDEKKKRNADFSVDMYFKEKNYYCKDMDLFIVMEPCIMCSMALVHSRINRVFYCISHENEYMGGLNKNIMLNHCESLNHKFPVFLNVEIDYCLKKKKELGIL